MTSIRLFFALVWTFLLAPFVFAFTCLASLLTIPYDIATVGYKYEYSKWSDADWKTIAIWNSFLEDIATIWNPVFEAWEKHEGRNN